MKENDFLHWIYSKSDFAGRGVLIGPGDDMAEVSFPAGTLLVAVDQVLDGVHFDLAKHGAYLAGRKALARNLSDVAAMAALPVGAVASVALPKDFTQADAEELYRGLRELGDEFNCPIVGGDVSTWEGKLAISVSIYARRSGVTGGIKPVRRNGAKPRQAIFVTGSLGGAWAGERHMKFTPRIKEAIMLALRYRLKAMMDISDGLAKDLHRMCRASGCGAEIFADKIPIHPDASLRQGVAPLEAALYDGEDYELLLTIPAGQAEKLAADSESENLPVKVTHIGFMTAGDEIVITDSAGVKKPLPDEGWEHKTGE